MHPAFDDTKNQEGLAFWNSAWGVGVEERSFSPHTRFIETTKWSYLKEDLDGLNSGRAVEVGCGSGHIGSLLAEAGFEVDLLDYSEAALACARNSYTTLGGRDRKRYVMGHALSLPFPDGSLDVVASCGVLEHFENIALVMAEMARVLKPGGLFYADIVPDKFSLARVFERMHPRTPGWYEIRVNKTQLKDLVKAVGLDIIRLFPAGVLPPRGIPGSGRFRLLKWMERISVEWPRFIWRKLDATLVAEWLGMYYYVAARKRVPEKADPFPAALPGACSRAGC